MSDRSDLGMSNVTSVGMPGAGTIRDMRQMGGPSLDDVNVNSLHQSKHPIKNQA